MARPLKEKLPRNFDKIAESGDFDAFKEVFTERTLDAKNRHGNTALHMRGVPEEFKIWMLDQGLDVDIRNEDGDTPLHVHSHDWNLSPDFLLKRGADVCAVNNEGESVAYSAAFFPENLKKLIDAGADPYARANDGTTPLMRVIRSANTGQIIELAEITKLLSGTEFTDAEFRETQERIIAMGERFENVREVYNEESVDQASADMIWLYDRFDIPEELRANTPILHDGVSPIELPGDTWQEQFIEGYDLLVPAMGKAKSLQGEAIRIAGRVSNEFHGNGGVNWDKDFKRMAKSLNHICEQGVPLGEPELEELAAAVKSVRKGEPTEEEIDTLPRLATKWVAQNPQPLPLGEVDYKR
ncbi:ankyrin repeat domain-containing protein [Corynebacterium glutamicum]|uniref:ankyrin repeat domain-containing protein n=1 Tax=Corynebacterium glutamicum TaxID=1718 RepID=UPI001C0E6CB7|nr:ankyrin repeat domain-containing protein [Corynebacterium glutamicum]QWQ83084.1 hypothetical protein B5C28_00820 [Corynebacterium glutamicum]